MLKSLGSGVWKTDKVVAPQAPRSSLVYFRSEFGRRVDAAFEEKVALVPEACQIRKHPFHLAATIAMVLTFEKQDGTVLAEHLFAASKNFQFVTFHITFDEMYWTQTLLREVLIQRVGLHLDGMVTFPPRARSERRVTQVARLGSIEFT